jgi:ParB family chromosome partitioning protein
MGSPQLVALEDIRPNPYQPRSIFDPETLAELSKSIEYNGLIQPLVVRRATGGGFELIAGERRFMASRQAGLDSVPVVVRDATRQQMLEVAMVENLQREDLNPMEEAEAYQRLATEFNLTQEQIAERVGKSRPTVTNSLRLLSLPEEIRDHVSRGTISAGHARAILVLNDEPARMRLAKEIVRDALSVRQAEIKAQGKKSPGPRRAKKRSHPALEAYEERLRNRFGTQVRVVGGVARGRVELHYFSEEDLERVISLAGIDPQL